MDKCKVKLKWGWLPDSKFNKKNLDLGMKVESEHSSSKCVQKQIAKAHLVEDPKYYQKLIKMERK